MIIAIDGPVGSGKSTVAKMIAADLGFTGFGKRSAVGTFCRNGIACV